MSFPPTLGQLKAIAEDLKEEVKKRKVCTLWRGGTIPSNFKSFFADVDPEGNFKKIFFKEGDRREFFALEWLGSFNKSLVSEYLGKSCKGKILAVGLHALLPVLVIFFISHTVLHYMRKEITLDPRDSET